jgi:hypothetical protein
MTHVGWAVGSRLQVKTKEEMAAAIGHEEAKGFPTAATRRSNLACDRTGGAPLLNVKASAAGRSGASGSSARSS